MKLLTLLFIISVGCSSPADFHGVAGEAPADIPQELAESTSEEPKVSVPESLPEKLPTPVSFDIPKIVTQVASVLPKVEPTPEPLPSKEEVPAPAPDAGSLALTTGKTDSSVVEEVAEEPLLQSEEVLIADEPSVLDTEENLKETDTEEEIVDVKMHGSRRTRDAANFLPVAIKPEPKNESTFSKLWNSCKNHPGKCAGYSMLAVTAVAAAGYGLYKGSQHLYPGNINNNVEHFFQDDDEVVENNDPIINDPIINDPIINDPIIEEQPEDKWKPRNKNVKNFVKVGNKVLTVEKGNADEMRGYLSEYLPKVQEGSPTFLIQGNGNSRRISVMVNGSTRNVKEIEFNPETGAPDSFILLNGQKAEIRGGLLEVI